MNINNPVEPIPEPNPPPSSIILDEVDPQPPSFTSPITLLQINSHRSKAVLQNVLQAQTHHLIAVQEPWINRFTLRPVDHPAWDLVLPMGHASTSLDDQVKTCIYLSKTFPTKTFTALPTGSPLLTAVEIDDPEVNLRLRAVSWYNPPADFCGLPVLREWLSRHKRRSTPKLLPIDSNLHHRAWNPLHQRRTHPQSPELMQMCGTHSFKLTSLKGVPTFYLPRGDGKGTTIDLVWANFMLSRRIHRCEVISDTFGSDHQAIVTVLNLSPPPLRNTATMTKLDLFSFVTGIEKALEGNTCDPLTPAEIGNQVQELTQSIQDAFHRQGKTVPVNPHRQKLWWDQDHLGPIVNNRNRARKWMFLSKLPHARKCYLEWQAYF